MLWETHLYSTSLKPNPDKCHLILSVKNDDLMVQIGNECIFNSAYEKILGVHYDNKLNYETHLSKLCKKASQKLHALAKVSSFMICRQRLNYHECFYSITIKLVSLIMDVS